MVKSGLCSVSAGCVCVSWCHNMICARIKENSAIDIRRLNEEFEDNIHCNIPEALSILKPDIIFEEPEIGNVNIIEVTISKQEEMRN